MPAPRIDVDAVTALVRQVAADVVLPRHRQLLEGDVQEKSPGELVTVADREAEALLTDGLSALLPGVPVVGEEATAADPSVYDRLRDAGAVWLVDPLDGTSNFVAGSPDFAVMVALVVAGRTVAGWVHQPLADRTWVAERGAGAFRDGERLRLTARTGPLRGAVLTRVLPQDLRDRLQDRAAELGEVGPGRLCAGVDYPLVAEGAQDFVLFWRTLAWDHAPGALLVEEAGGKVGRLDGEPYLPTSSRPGLLVAADDQVYSRVRSALAS